MGIGNPVHLLFIAVVALLVLGPKRLPEVVRALGKGVREFRAALDQGAAKPAPEKARPALPEARPTQTQTGTSEHELE
jgi:TatA/E family protein of Tat protein translocase